MRQIVDMPDRKLDLFIQLCLQNHGRLGKNKYKQFPMLTQSEINKLSDAVQNVIKTQQSEHYISRRNHLL